MTSQFNMVTATQALFTLIENAPTLVELTEKVCGEYVNDNPKNCPWVGVYKGPREEEPYTLGRGASNWRADAKFRIIIQESGGKTGQEVDERLEEWVQKIIQLIKEDITVFNGVVVATVKRFEVNYGYWQDADEMDVFFQQANIIVTAEVRT